jgi:hypothetical protein
MSLCLAITGVVLAPIGCGSPTSTASLPSRPPLGLVSSEFGGGPTVLSRLDPLTLRPVGRRVRVGEYHDAWSFSPDRSRLALGISAPGRERVGIRIVDLARMGVSRDVPTGIAATALSWVAPDRLVAVLLSGDVVVVDPASGAITRRWEAGSQTEFSLSKWTEAPGMLVALLSDEARLGAARLVVVDRGATRMRVMRLARIRIGARRTANGEVFRDAGLAVAARRKQAFVVGASSPLAAVDLRTGRVRYRRVTGAAAMGVRAGALRASHRDALWLGNGLLAVFGDDVAASRTVPAGVRLIDTAHWTSRAVAPRATHALRAGRRLLIHAKDRRGAGLSIHTLRGRRLRHLFDGEAMDVEAAGGYLYALNSRAVRIVAARSGRLVHRSRGLPRGHEIELLSGPRSR